MVLIARFLCPLGIELFVAWGEPTEEAQKSASVHAFLVGCFFEHFQGKLVVGGLGDYSVSRKATRSLLSGATVSSRVRQRRPDCSALTS
jgi:hypothetical protein